MISVHKPGLTHIYQVYLVNVEIKQVLQTLSFSLIYNRQAKCTIIRETYPPPRFKKGLRKETYPSSHDYIYQVSRFFIGSSLDYRRKR